MPKFAGKIGFSEENVEVKKGVFETRIVERSYRGDVIKDTRKFDDKQSILGQMSVNNSLSILADAYADQHFYDMRYVWWNGRRWIISDVEVQRPRLILRLGGVYNGPTAEDFDNGDPAGTP